MSKKRKVELTTYAEMKCGDWAISTHDGTYDIKFDGDNILYGMTLDEARDLQSALNEMLGAE